MMSERLRNRENLELAFSTIFDVSVPQLNKSKYLGLAKKNASLTLSKSRIYNHHPYMGTATWLATLEIC